MKRYFYIFIAAALAGCSPAQKQGGYDYLYKGLPFEMKRVELPSIPARDFLLTDFGARGDGAQLCSEAFAAGIAAVEQAGGGRLVVPAGIWLTGPVSLCSRLDLHLQKGAVIVFSKDMDLYPLIDTYFEGLGTKRCQSPLTARGVQDVAITGEGIIDGSGEAWRPVKKGKLTSADWKTLVGSGGVVNEKGDIWFPSEGSKLGYETSDMNVPRHVTTDEDWNSVKDFLRPVMVSLVECDRVLLSGVTFRNSPAWNIHPMLCRDVTLDGVTVQNPWYAQNGDGVDVESCDGVVIVRSSFDVGDDAICIKSGKDKEGRERGKPACNVIVDDCTVFHGHGGFVVGSEMSGGVSNISVSDCRFLGTDVGLRFKSVRGRGGVVEHIYIRDIVMTDIPTEPLLFDLFYGGKSAMEALAEGDEEQTGETGECVAADQTTPVFRDIHIERVVCNGARRAMFFNGLPEMNISDVTIADCAITATYGAEICESDGVELRHVVIEAAQGPSLILRNAKNVQIDGFRSRLQPATLEITGNRNKKISIINSSISPQGITASPAALDEVYVNENGH